MLIVFDLDDTLIDTSGSITPYKFQEFFYLLQREGVSVGSFSKTIREIASLDKKCMTSKETVRQILERYQASHLFDQAQSLFSEPLPRDFKVETTPHAKKVLQSLKEQNHILTIVTMGKASFQLEKMEKAGLEPSIFSKIKVSESSQKRPHYEPLVQEFSVSPSESIAVGDRIPIDLMPAHELGWRTVHMRWGRGRLWKKKEEWIERAISDLSELMEII